MFIDGQYYCKHTIEVAENEWNWIEKTKLGTTIDNISGTTIQRGKTKFVDNEEYYRKIILTMYQNNCYQIGYFNSGRGVENTTFDQILSTFKFLD